MMKKIKPNEYDDKGILKGMQVWDWVVTHGGKVVQITHDDMNDLKGEDIARYATWEEIFNESAMYGLFKGTRPTLPASIQTEEYPIVCESCKGSGFIPNPEAMTVSSATVVTCPACNGNRYVIKKVTITYPPQP